MAVVPLEEEAEGQKKALLRRLKGILDEISREERIEKRDILELLKERQELSIPLGIFASRDLGILEAVVKCLKEDRKKTITEIAKAMKRDKRTIWSTYDAAKEKVPGRLSVDGDLVPVSLFSNRGLGALESLAVYLHTEKALKYSQIARILHRDQRTIWTVCSRAKKKNAN
jgi:predicted DNA-binding protein (UPF0251 family)